MPAPYQYIQGFQDPTEALLSGLKMGSSVANAIAQREAAQEKLKQQQALAQVTQSLGEKIRSGNVTPEDFAQFQLVAPKDQSEAAAKVFEAMNKEKQRSLLDFGSKVMSALDSNNPKFGLDLLRERAVAERNNGNEQQAKAYEDYAQMIELDDPSRAVGTIGGMIRGLPGGKEVIESYIKGKEERRAQELAPITQREKSAEASLKEMQLKFAPDKLATDLQLTKTQIQQAKASIAASTAAAAKSGAEAKRAEAEAAQLGAGIVPFEKRPELEGKFRKEYSDQTKGYQEVKSAYGRILASDDSAVGDLSLIFGYMKMLDPGSVVREGEFATAQNAAGVPERILNIYNKTLSGERLSESQRKSFKGQAGKLYETAQKQEATVRSGIDRIAKGYGLKTENIFYEPSETAPVAPQAERPAAVTAQRQAPAQQPIFAVNPKTGARIMSVDGGNTWTPAR